MSSESPRTAPGTPAPGERAHPAPTGATRTPIGATPFADEARSRTARLLRMANTADDRLRQWIIDYAETTPEPVMGSHGIVTTGCPRCHRTMWQQRDTTGPVAVCASCGHVDPPHTDRTSRGEPTVSGTGDMADVSDMGG